MVYAAEFVGLCLQQRGDTYVFGHEKDPENTDPEIFDCSELVEWACARVGVRPTMPDGSWIQVRHCRANGTEISVSEAIETQGALLFAFVGDPFNGPRPTSAHVAVSLGNGSTIEARGTAWGVGSWSVANRPWTHAGRVPGLDYGPPPGPPSRGGPGGPPWPGRYLTQPPIMKGDDVRQWQEQMRRRGWTIATDGDYGPDSEEVCRSFQADKALRVDGVVGPDTWAAAWSAPIT